MNQDPKAGASASPTREKQTKLDPFTRNFVQKCARQLVGKFGFKQQDREDIEQSLYLKLAKRLQAADPNDPKWRALLAISARRHIVSLIRIREAEKRNHRRTCSLNVRMGGPEGTVELATVVTSSEIPSRQGRTHRTEQELVELALDVREALANIADEEEREFLERLAMDSIAQVGRDMDIPRTTLNSWLPKLRKQFENLSLKEYL
jgi:RNA polymerase sigma factor (sigma-70 family)